MDYARMARIEQHGGGALRKYRELVDRGPYEEQRKFEMAYMDDPAAIEALYATPDELVAKATAEADAAERAAQVAASVATDARVKADAAKAKAELAAGQSIN